MQDPLINIRRRNLKVETAPGGRKFSCIDQIEIEQALKESKKKKRKGGSRTCDDGGPIVPKLEPGATEGPPAGLQYPPLGLGAQQPHPGGGHQPYLGVPPPLPRHLPLPELHQLPHRHSRPFRILRVRRQARAHPHRRRPLLPKIKHPLITPSPVTEHVDPRTRAPAVDDYTVAHPVGGGRRRGEEGVGEEQDEGEEEGCDDGAV